MADYSAKDVAALRKATGAGMMDCKNALEATSGDIEAAKEWLRTKGLAGASKREGRAASQGTVDVVVDGNVGAIVELNCETDFVAKGDDFKNVVADLTKLVAKEGDSGLADKTYNGEKVSDAITQLGARLGEKVELGRVVRFETSDGLLDAYKHNQNERGVIGVLVELGGVDASDAKAREIAHDVALHVASAAPRYVTRDEVPADALDKERAVLEELTRNEGKPEDKIPMIVEGRLKGFYQDYVLTEQAFVRDPKTTIGKLLGSLGKSATIRRFARVKIGEE
ncbi:MAG TPA: translation elongation factor Ts [Acidimicrobiia bacterium]|nr:translation elongation factor Ts [Acidimicrobiia bacterium]